MHLHAYVIKSLKDPDEAMGYILSTYEETNIKKAYVVFKEIIAAHESFTVRLIELIDGSKMVKAHKE